MKGESEKEDLGGRREECEWVGGVVGQRVCQLWSCGSIDEAEKDQVRKVLDCLEPEASTQANNGVAPASYGDMATIRRRDRMSTCYISPRYHICRESLLSTSRHAFDNNPRK